MGKGVKSKETEKSTKVKVSSSESVILKFLALLDHERSKGSDEFESANPDFYLRALGFHSEIAERTNQADSNSSHCSDECCSDTDDEDDNEAVTLGRESGVDNVKVATDDNVVCDVTTSRDASHEVAGKPPIISEHHMTDIARQFVRDNRKLSKNFDAPAKENKKFLNALFSPKPAIFDSLSVERQLNSKLPERFRTVPDQLGPSVRVKLSCEGKGSAGKKPTVLHRKTTVAEIIETIKNKFNVGKKYNTLIYQYPGSNSDRQGLLSDVELLTLPDDSLLTLTKSDRVIMTQPLLNDSNDQPCMATAKKGNNFAAFSDSLVCDVADDDSFEDLAPLEAAFNAVAVDSELSNSSPILPETLPQPPLPLPMTEPPTSPKVASVWKPPSALINDSLSQSNRAIDSNISNSLKTDQHNLRYLKEYPAMLQIREALPIFQSKSELLTAIANNPVVLVSGETGSGKTTQLPAYILEEMIDRGVGSEAYIIVTQPRRIAAMSVAERVAQERLEKVGKTIGYQVRLHSAYSKDTRILFCTTGVLLRRLQHSDFLSSVSHIIVDEVHERQVETDFLMALLRDKLSSNEYPHIKLILMSATLQEKSIMSYFSSPVVYVQGRTHPVEDHFIDQVFHLTSSQQVQSRNGRGNNSIAGSNVAKLKSQLQAPQGYAAFQKSPQYFDVIADLVLSIIRKYSGHIAVSPDTTNDSPVVGKMGDAILVFLSGMEAIKKVDLALRMRGLPNMRNVSLYMLHGSLPPEQQRRVFRRTNPGEWKVVLSTNIAETSLTVEDVTHVIDCGLVKEMRYDAVANMSNLKEVFVSRASTRQRAGRAGRVRAGHSWRLYSEEYLGSRDVQDFPIPEIRRIPLEEVILQVLLLQLGSPEEFLGKCLDPPSMSQIRSSLGLLLEVKAILPLNDLPLTPLGYHLAKMPMDVRVGKMLIMSSLLKCTESALTIAATLGCKSPFANPPDKFDEASKAHRNFIKHTNKERDVSANDFITPHHSLIYSDHLAVVNAYNQWDEIVKKSGKQEGYNFTRRNYLSASTLEEIKALRQQFQDHLVQAGFIKINRHESVRPQTIDVKVDEEEEAGQEMSDFQYQLGDAMSASHATINEKESSEHIPHVLPARLARLMSPEDQTMLGTALAQSSHDMLLCAICAGLVPNIALVERFADKDSKHRKGRGKGGRHLLPARIVQSDGREVFIHPSSVLHKQLNPILQQSDNIQSFLVYHKKVASTKIYLHDCSAVSSTAVLLFGGDITIHKPPKGKGKKSHVLVGGWLPLRLSELQAVLCRRLQTEIEELLKVTIEDPNRDISTMQMILIKVLDTLISDS